MLDISGWFTPVSYFISCRVNKFEFWIGGNVDVSLVDFLKDTVDTARTET
jgi:hypothetical protein